MGYFVIERIPPVRYSSYIKQRTATNLLVSVAIFEQGSLRQWRITRRSSQMASGLRWSDEKSHVAAFCASALSWQAHWPCPQATRPALLERSSKPAGRRLSG